MRFIWFLLFLALVLSLPFVFLGESFTRQLSGEAVLAWLRGWGHWGWAAVVALLVADLVLPIPSTAVMAAAGFLYGPWIGGAVSAGGSLLAGMVAYGLCRAGGRHWAQKWVGMAAWVQAERLFLQQGAPLVALSRWLPILPEVVCCVAGLMRMPWRVFIIALICGSLPMGFAYAAIGATGVERPYLALGLSIAGPAACWIMAQILMRRAARAKNRA